MAIDVNLGILVIGSPGSLSASGVVYIYSRNINGIGWSLSQELSVPYLLPGDQFGATLSMNNGTLIISAPFRNSNRGEIFCFRIYQSTGIQSLFIPRFVYFYDQKCALNVGVFIFSQDISLNNQVDTAFANDYFGCSVAVYGNLIVVGAKGREAAAIYLGTTPNPPASSTGAVYIYERDSYTAEYLLFQTLMPTNVRSYDGFGVSVAVDGDLIIASALQQYTGLPLPSKAIYSFTTTGDYFSTSIIQGNFRLMWEGYQTRDISANASAYIFQSILEEDLHTEAVIVSRSAMSNATSGYTWTVKLIVYLVRHIIVSESM